MNATGQAHRRVGTKGVVAVLGIQFMVGKAYAGMNTHVVWDTTTVSIFDTHGTLLIDYPRPAPETRAVGNGKPRGFMANQPSPMS